MFSRAAATVGVSMSQAMTSGSVSANRPSSRTGQPAKAGSRWAAGGLFHSGSPRAISAASIAIVPEPAIGSSRISRRASKRASMTSAAARFSRMGAAPAARR